MLLPTFSVHSYNEPDEPFCEIMVKEGFKSEIMPGESTEIFAIYNIGNYKNYAFDWYLNNYAEYESLGKTANDGIRVTCETRGTVTVRLMIISKDAETWNEVIAEDEIEITVLDDRTFFEKINDFFGYTLAYSCLTGIWSLFIALAAAVGIFNLPVDLFGELFG